MLNGNRLDFLETQGVNTQISENFGGKKSVELEKLKINKQFKIVNPLPKF